MTRIISFTLKTIHLNIQTTQSINILILRLVVLVKVNNIFFRKTRIMKSIKILFCILFNILISTTLSFGQCEGYQDYPEGEEAATQAFSDYKDLMAQGHLDSAYRIWKKLYEHAPAGSELHYKDGVIFYREFMRQAPEGREVVLFQTQLLKLYDRRMKCFGYENGTYNVILAEKAVEMYDMNYDEDVTRRTFNYVLETGEKRFQPEWLSKYATFCTYLFGAERLGRKILQKKQIIINKILDYNIKYALDEERKEQYIAAKKTANTYFDIYLKEPSNCEVWVANFKHQLKKDPDNDSLKLQIKQTVRTMDCLVAEQLWSSIVIKKKPVIETVAADNKIEEPIENVSKGRADRYSRLAEQAQEAFKEQKYPYSIELYEQAISETGRPALKAKYAYNIAEIYFNKLNDKVKAREYAWASANYDKAWGKPYLLIGDMYAASYTDCVQSKKVKSLDLTLAAIQQWKQAVTINSELSDLYTERIEPYKDYLPSINCEETINKIIELGCWINEDIEVQVCK